MNKRLAIFSMVVITGMITLIIIGLPGIAAAADWGYCDGSPISWSGNFGSGGDNKWYVDGDNHVHFSDDGSSYDGVRLMRTDSSFQPGTGDLEISYNFGCQATDFYDEPVGDTFMVWDPFPYDAYGDISTAGSLRPPLGFMARKDHSSREVLFNIVNSHAGQQNGYDVCCLCGDGFVRYDDFKVLVKKEHGGLFLFISGDIGSYSVYDYRDFSSTSNPFTIWYDYSKGGVLVFDGLNVVTDSVSPITITPTNTHTGNTVYYNAANPPTISATYSGAGSLVWRIDILNSSEESIRGVPADFDEAAYGGSYLQWNSDATISFAWDITNDASSAASDNSYTARIAVIDEANMEAQTQDIELVRDDTPPSSSVSSLDTFYGNNTFTVSWTGSDSQIGIASYTLKAKKGSGGWNTVYSGADTSYDYTPSGADIYYFEVCATDSFGNAETCGGTPEQSTTVETTPPTSSVNALNTYYGNTTIPVSWSGSDTQIGMGSGDYTVKVKKDSGSWVDWVTNTSDTSGYYTHSGAGVYYFEVCAVDAGGNAETCSGASEAQTTVDLTPPVSSAAALNSFYGPDAFTVSWSATDLQAVSCYEVQYRKDYGAWTEWPSLGCTSLTSSDFTHSGAGFYEFDIRAKDELDNWENFSNTADTSTTVEETPPTTSMTALNSYYGTGDIAVAWSASDSAPDNGISCYDVEVQKDSGGWNLWQDCTTSTGENYTHSGSGFYEYRTRAKDGVGNWSAWGATQVSTIVDAAAPVSAVSALPAYNSGTTITVSWSGSDPAIGSNSGSGLNCYDVDVRKDSGGWTPWLTCTTDTTADYTHSGGGTYEFRSRATDDMGNEESDPGVADASTVVDSSPPVFSYVYDGTGTDESYTGSADTLSANWSATDMESGVDHYEYAIGTFSGDTSLVNWTNIGTNTSVTNSSLTLVHNTTYYITVRAYNVAGYYADQSTNGIKGDLQPPAASMSDPNSDYMGATDFTVAWSATDGAGESGVQNYTVQYKDGSGGTWTDWTPAPTTDTSRTFSGIHSHTYYFRVIAQDNAGNWSAYPAVPDYHKSTTVDTSQPSAPGGISEGSTDSADLDFIADAASFSAHWNAVVSTPGIQSYSYRIGTSAGAGDVIDWTETSDTYFTETGLTLAEGTTYYVTVKAKNLAGDFGYEGNSDGITIDLTAPTCAVTDLWNYQGSESFGVQWSGTDGVSGIASYDIQYRYGAGAWTDWLAASALTSELFGGQNGHTYYFQCRATDNAGLVSGYADGDGDTSTTINTTIPVAPEPVTDGAAADSDYSSDTTKLSSGWPAVTDATGYKVCFGRGEIPDNCEVMAWTDAGTATSYEKTGLALQHGETYFARALAYNSAALEGTPGNSDGVLIDTAPSGTPAVTDDGDYDNSDNDLIASWSADPGISGITEYQYAVGTTAGDTDILSWTTNGTDTSVTITGRPDLAEGQEYFISVKALSGAGVWSDAGTSDGIVFDSVPPVCTVAALPEYQSTESFAVSWTATDEVSGLAYSFDVQYRDGADGTWTDLLSGTSLMTTNFTGEDLHTYYFQCRALDNAVNLSDYPGGDGDTNTSLDLTPPEPSPVRDGIGEDKSFTSSTTSISANWDPVDGAIVYLYAIGTSAGGTDIADWTETADTAFSLTGLSLAEGATYYTSVKSRNNSGLISDVQTSDGILVDLTPPDEPEVADAGSLTGENTLSFSWTTKYSAAPVVSHEYAIGTSKDTMDFRGWTQLTPDSLPGELSENTDLSFSGSIDDAVLTDGTTYYIFVRSTDEVGNVSAAGVSDGITKTNTAVLDITYLPDEIRAVPEDGQPVEVNVEFTFTESKGVGIKFGQLQEFFILDTGLVMENPIQTSDFEIPGGAETRLDMALAIPADVVATTMGGKTTSVVTIRKSYTGVDDVQNPYQLDIEVPVYLSSAASEILFQVNSVALTLPETGAAMPKDGGNKLAGVISVSGTGTINGMWLLDGKPYRTFRVDATGEDTVNVELALPADLAGAHTARLRVTMPEMFETEKVSFEISDEAAAGPYLTEFMAGEVRIADVRATYDKAYNAWAGTGKVEISVGGESVGIDSPATFEKLRVRNENGRSVLERGFLFADTSSTLENGPFKVEIDRVLVTADRAAADGKVTYMGTDEVLGVGPLYFYGAEIGEEGIRGQVDLSVPQKGKLGVFQFAIGKVDFSYGPAGIELDASGGFKTVPDPVLDMGLSIHASVDEASMKAEIGPGTTIDLNGFAFKVNTGSLAVEDDQLVFKCSGSLDLGPAFGGAWNVEVADAKFYATGRAELAGFSGDGIDLGLFTVSMDAESLITIDDISKSIPSAGLNADVLFTGDAAGATISARANLNITTDGAGDAELAAADGQAVASFESGGTTLTLESGVIKFSGGKIASAEFSGTLSLEGTEIAMDDISLADGTLSGNSAGAATVESGGITLAISGSAGFTWGADGFSFTADEVSLSADSIISGASGMLALTDLTFSDAGISARSAARQELTLNGTSITVKKAEVSASGTNAQVTLDGAISMAEPDINVAFKGLTINSDGTVSGEIESDGSQSVEMFGLTFGIESFTLDLTGETLALNATGMASFNSESSPVPFNDLLIASGNVKGSIDVTADAPAAIEGFAGLTINRLEIADNTLFMDGALELPAPLEKSVEFNNVAFDFAGESENVSGGVLVLEDSSNTPIKIKGFDFHVDRVVIPNFMGIGKASDIPETLAKVDLAASQEICGEAMDLKIKGLEMTADGFRDVRLNIAGDVSNALYSKVFPGEAGLTVAGLVFAIKNGAVDKFDLSGELAFQGTSYEIPSIEITGEGTMRGAVKTGKGINIDIDGVKLSAQGNASFKVDASTECEGGMSVVLKDVEVDFSGPVGAAMKVKVPELAFENGNLSAEGDLNESLYINGVKFDINHATFTGRAGAGEESYIRASFDGSVGITRPSLKLAFEGLVISSDGEIGGDIVVHGAQEFVAYGATFVVDGIRIARPVAEEAATTGGENALAIYTSGAISFKQGSTMAFDKLMIAGGRLGGMIEVAQEEAAKVPWAENMGITKVEFRDGHMFVSGFLNVGDPVNMKMRVEDLAIDYEAHVKGGKVIIDGDDVSISVGDFEITISGAAYDISTRLLSIDGTLKLPPEVTDAALDFTSMGISLAKEGYAKIDTSRMQSDIKFLYDKQHILTMNVDRFAVGQKSDDIWYLTMSGNIGLVVGQQTVMLNCERFTIFSNGQFDIQGVNGEFAVLIYKFVIENFSFNDEGNNPYIEMSGELDIPPYAAAKVDSFKRYKNGNVAFDEVMVYVAYGPLEFLLGLSYHFDAAREIERFAGLMSQGADSIAKVWESDLNLVTSYKEALNMITSAYGTYKDEEIAIDGTMFVNGYGVAVSGYYNPQEWAVDGDVCGLSHILKIIHKCPVLVFECLGGGVTYTFSGGLQGDNADAVAGNSGGALSSGAVTELTHFIPDYLQVRLRTTAGFVNTDIDSISGQLSIDTQGMVGVEGDVTLMGMLKVGEGHMEFDPYNMYTYGYGEVQAELVDYFPIKLAKAGSVEFMFDADIGGGENQSNSISDYGAWSFGAGAAAYKAAAASNNGETSASNAGSMALSAGTAAAGSLSDSGLGDSAWGKLLKGEWDGTSIDWWIKGGYDVDILGGLYTAHAMLTVDKVGWIYDFDVPFSLNISSDDVDRETGFDFANIGFGFDGIGIGGAHLTYGMKWDVGGVGVSDGYTVEMGDISANVELFAEFDMDVTVDLKVKKVKKHMTLKWNNNGTIENVEDDYFEGTVPISAEHMQAIPFPSCSVRWRECNCHSVKYKSCGRWSCKTKKKTVCGSCPEFYDCPPDTFFKKRTFDKDLYLRVDRNGFHASFK